MSRSARASHAAEPSIPCSLLGAVEVHHRRAIAGSASERLAADAPVKQRLRRGDRVVVRANAGMTTVAQ